MKFKALLIALLAALAPQLAHACSDLDIASTRAGLSKRFTNTKVESVKCTDIDGLYEVIAGSNVVYVNKDVSRMIVGSIFDTSTPEMRDLTPDIGGKKKAVAMAKHADWSEFPADTAVVTGKGRKYKIAIFTDLNCHFCQGLHLALKGMDDVEVHEYVGSILNGSGPKAEAVYCSKTPAAVIDKAYAGSKELGEGGCPAAKKAEGVNAFMSKKGWNGTPVIVRSDGLVMRGFPSPEALRSFLETQVADNGGAK